MDKTKKKINSTKTKTTKSKKNLKLSKILKTAYISAIILAIITLPSFILNNVSRDMTFTVKLINTTITVLSTIVLIYLLRGYLGIAKHEKFKFLKCTTQISIVMAIVIAILSIAGLIFTMNKTWAIIGLSGIIIIGLSQIAFGISIYKSLIEKTKVIMTSIALLYIITGVIYVTLYFMIQIPFFSIAISILEAVMFNKLSKIY